MSECCNISPLYMGVGNKQFENRVLAILDEWVKKNNFVSSISVNKVELENTNGHVNIEMVGGNLGSDKLNDVEYDEDNLNLIIKEN